MKKTETFSVNCWELVKKCADWLSVPAELAGDEVRSPAFILAIYRCAAESGLALL